MSGELGRSRPAYVLHRLPRSTRSILSQSHPRNPIHVYMWMNLSISCVFLQHSRSSVIVPSVRSFSHEHQPFSKTSCLNIDEYIHFPTHTMYAQIKLSYSFMMLRLWSWTSTGLSISRRRFEILDSFITFGPFFLNDSINSLRVPTQTTRLQAGKVGGCSLVGMASRTCWIKGHRWWR